MPNKYRIQRESGRSNQFSHGQGQQLHPKTCIRGRVAVPATYLPGSSTKRPHPHLPLPYFPSTETQVPTLVQYPKCVQEESKRGAKGRESAPDLRRITTNIAIEASACVPTRSQLIQASTARRFQTSLPHLSLTGTDRHAAGTGIRPEFVSAPTGTPTAPRQSSTLRRVGWQVGQSSK